MHIPAYCTITSLIFSIRHCDPFFKGKRYPFAGKSCYLAAALPVPGLERDWTKIITKTRATCSEAPDTHGDGTKPRHNRRLLAV